MSIDSDLDFTPARPPRDEPTTGAVGRFLGHSAAAALAFVGLTLISLVPVCALRSLHGLGFDDVSVSLHALEAVLQVVDASLFAIIFLTGALVFVAEVLADAERRIVNLLKRRHP